MGNWQNWAVIIILIACFGWVALKLYRYIMQVKKNESPCSSCATGCALKDLAKDKNDSSCSSSKIEKKDEKIVGKQD